LIKDRAHQLGKDFCVRGFFDELNSGGLIPVSMIQWQLTGRLDPALEVVLHQPR